MKIGPFEFPDECPENCPKAHTCSAECGADCPHAKAAGGCAATAKTTKADGCGGCPKKGSCKSGT